MKLRLVKNGVFPITTEPGEHNIKATGFSIPGTIQGEGKLAGIPAIFIRTSGCNLRCSWKDDAGRIDICDTAYSSHDVREFEDREPEEIAELVSRKAGNVKHVVITGGEPCLQPEAVTKLAGLLKKAGFHISLETNGTIFHQEMAGYIDFFSISPKLSSSEPDELKNKKLSIPVPGNFIRDHHINRVNTGVIREYINACMSNSSYYGDITSERVKRANKDFQLKFVIASKKDETEIRDNFLSALGNINPEDILVMPLGSDPELCSQHSRLTAEIAIRNGWRYTPRIHLDLFGNKEGV